MSDKESIIEKHMTDNDISHEVETIEKTSFLRSIRFKSIIVLAVLLVLVFLVYLAIILGIFPKSFQVLEHSQSGDTIIRVHRVLYDDLRSILNILLQYSQWDGTLEVMDNFSNTAAHDYTMNNLSNEFLRSVRLEFAIAYFPNGSFAFGKGYDYLNDKDIEIPQELSHLEPGVHPLMINTSYAGSRSGGLLHLSSGKTLAVISDPIQQTIYDENGRTNGRMIFARTFNSNTTMLDYATRSRICFSMIPYQSNDSRSVQLRRESLGTKPVVVDVSTPLWKNNREFLIAPLHDTSNRYCSPTDSEKGKRIASYSLLQDVFGEPVLFLQSDIPRDIVRLEISSLSLAFGMLLLVVCIVSFVIALFIEMVVIKPVTELYGRVKQIADRSEMTDRVKVKSRDELGSLAFGINRMLDSLELGHQELENQRAESEKLLMNMLPEVVSRKLKAQGHSHPSFVGTVGVSVEDSLLNTYNTTILIAESFPNISVIISDIVGFTVLSSKTESHKLVSILNMMFSSFDQVCSRVGVEKIKTIGDAFMAVAGAPIQVDDHADRAIKQALGMLEVITTMRKQLDVDVNIRVGINSGPAVAGIIGTTKYVYDIFGDTVTVASTMEYHSLPGCVLVSESTVSLVTIPYPFEKMSPFPVKDTKVTGYLLRPEDISTVNE